MSNPTYEELQAENEKLRAKLSAGADPEFTKELELRMAPRHHLMSVLFGGGFIKGGKVTIRPVELWGIVFPCDKEPSTRDLAKLGRSLESLGWARSAKRGNLVFTLQVGEYAR